MSRFNNPNLFRLGFNLNWKNNPINFSTVELKRYLFEYNLLEKVLLKSNYLILRNFFNYEVFRHYLLLYKARSHRIFKKRQVKRKLVFKKYFIHKNLLKARKLNFFFSKFFFSKFFRNFFWLNIYPTKVLRYYQFGHALLNLSNIHAKTIEYKLFLVLFMRKFLNITSSSFQHLRTFPLFFALWRSFRLRAFFVLFFFFVYFFRSMLFYILPLTQISRFLPVQVSASTCRITNWYTFFSLQLLQTLMFFFHSVKTSFITILTPQTSNLRLLSGNQFWFFQLKNKLFQFTQKSINFTVFFWNKRTNAFYYGGHTLGNTFITFLRLVYKSVDFIKQRKFFFFKDTLYLLFLSVFFVNARIFSKHLSRLFMLIRRHRDLFQVLDWVLTSPVVLKWLQLRLFALHLTIKGRIEGADRAVVKNFGFGRIPRQMFNIYLIYSLSSARTWYGSYSIKLWFWFNEEAIYS